MKRIIKYFFSVLLLLILQISVINMIEYRTSTNLFLIIIIFICHKYNWKSGFLLSAILGFLYDILVSSHIGITSISLITVSLVIGSIAEYIFSDRIRYLSFYLILGMFIYNLMQFSINYLLGYDLQFHKVFTEVYSINTLYNFTILLFIYYLNMQRDSFLETFKIEGFERIEI